MVEPVDPYGNPLSGIAVTFTAPGVALVPSPTVMFSKGQTTITVKSANGSVAVAPTADLKAGIVMAQAKIMLPGNTSFTLAFTLTNLPGPASKVAVVGSAGETAVAGAAYAPLHVAVTDSYGNPVPNATVTFTVHPAVNGADATFASNALTATATSNNSGQAVAPTLTGNTKTDTTFTLIATVPNGTTSASFTLRNLADPLVGPSQSAVVNTIYAMPLFAQVTDVFGNPLRGVMVTFTAPANGPGGTFAGKPTATVVTNANGLAMAPAFKANTKAGTFKVTIAFNGAAPPETIQLVNLVGKPTH
jgi:hypothetical protein